MAKKTRRKPLSGRPRDSRATDAILKAALELGEEHGFDGITMEGIAARAGVGKMTIYRRWSNAWAIVADAFLAEVTRVSPVRECATTRESFLVSMLLVAKSFRGRQGKLLKALIGRAQTDERLLSALRDRWLLPRRELSRAIVRKGIERGELRANLNVDTVLDALYGPLYHRLLLPYERDAVRLSDTYIEALIDSVFSGFENRSR